MIRSLGWELRVELAGALQCSQVCRTQVGIQRRRGPSPGCLRRTWVGALIRYSRADVKLNARDVAGQRVKAGGDTNRDSERENDL